VQDLRGNIGGISFIRSLSKQFIYTVNTFIETQAPGVAYRVHII